jgi:uroporphyrinogen decarboxylase
VGELSTYERMSRMYAHQEADRVPITDVPWDATLERWRREGMPERVAFADYFGLDKFASIGVDNSPRYEVRTLEQTDAYRVYTTAWGATMRNWVHAGGVPEFLDFTIMDRPSWEQAKARMTPTRDRVNWERLRRYYSQWRKEGHWITANLWFGFDVTHSWVVGTERVLLSMVSDPEWLTDIFNHQLDLDLALYEMVWEAGYHFDEIRWPDDMGYKGTQFFSLAMYRDLLKPVHRKAADWAHARGVKVQLHSCGNINPLVPELIEIGIDMLNPIEVKAGMDPLLLKRQYGDRLAFHGGLNAALFDQPEVLWKQMEQVIPAMKVGGGYVLGSDHSVPQSVSLEQFRHFVELGKRLGSYV